MGWVAVAEELWGGTNWRDVGSYLRLGSCGMEPGLDWGNCGMGLENCEMNLEGCGMACGAVWWV